jgi:hypothetical protein
MAEERVQMGQVSLPLPLEFRYRGRRYELEAHTIHWPPMLKIPPTLLPLTLEYKGVRYRLEQRRQGLVLNVDSGEG